MTIEPMLNTSLTVPINSSILWLIPFIPAFGAIINGITGRLLKNNKIVDFIALGSVFVSFLITLTYFLKLVSAPIKTSINQTLWTWFDIGIAQTLGGTTQNVVNWAYKFDALSGAMALLVTGVGFLIHLFSTGYMADERNSGGYYRFMSYLNLFIFSMLNLILGANMVVMFLGWEGVGLCSYLLIGFYFEKKDAATAGKKAFIVNRIGDFGFLIGFFLIFFIYGTVDFNSMSNMTNHIISYKEITILNLSCTPTWWFNLIGCCLFLGACGKSAQIPLYVWLPDAMAGPTPVSALIHAATMVTSGLYMITRMNFIYINAPIALNVVLSIGSLTALTAASIGLTQYDIKKVLAYSTISQLGIMFMAMGAGAFSAGMFHVFTHAFFKATLFLGAGSVIMACHHEQDMRNMGGLRRSMPITFVSMSIATLAIVGMFPFSGFFSKDEIFWKVFESWYNRGAYNGPILNLVAWIMGMMTAAMTTFYMIRLMVMTFLGQYRGFDHGSHNNLTFSENLGHINNKSNNKPHIPLEVSWNMWLPVAILALLALLAGFINIPHSLHWLGSDHFSSWIDPLLYISNTNNHIESPIIEYMLMSITTLVLVPGMMTMAWYFYAKDPTWSKPKRFVYKFHRLFKIINAKYYIDEIYEIMFINPCKNLGEMLFAFDIKIIDGTVNGITNITLVISRASDWFDTQIIDGLLRLIAWVIQKLSLCLRTLQNGQVQTYAFVIYLSLLFFIFWKFIV
jgi:NADH-quinone oxidoreductase subunit L